MNMPIVCRKGSTQGYTALKMDIGINLLRDIPGAVINDPGGDLKPWQYEYRDYRLTNIPLPVSRSRTKAWTG